MIVDLDADEVSVGELVTCDVCHAGFSTYVLLRQHRRAQHATYHDGGWPGPPLPPITVEMSEQAIRECAPWQPELPLNRWEAARMDLIAWRAAEIAFEGRLP